MKTQVREYTKHRPGGSHTRLLEKVELKNNRSSHKAQHPDALTRQCGRAPCATEAQALSLPASHSPLAAPGAETALHCRAPQPPPCKSLQSKRPGSGELPRCRPLAHTCSSRQPHKEPTYLIFTSTENRPPPPAHIYVCHISIYVYTVF